MKNALAFSLISSASSSSAPPIAGVSFVTPTIPAPPCTNFVGVPMIEVKSPTEALASIPPPTL